ncbi:Ecm8p [Saccharomyces cerevisiae YJM1418]|nr:Ecm8p [Saccharomyces cerevisiae YJM1418]CAI4269100.1 CCN_G0002760.mRNA.1.CDS.1 [Saccharomyces cerevisiae]CAI7144990.1 CCN_G0002760.mRNA.1.CDS.1 [Saccharomyces cerevisiae]
MDYGYFFPAQRIEETNGVDFWIDSNAEFTQSKRPDSSTSTLSRVLTDTTNVSNNSGSLKRKTIKNKIFPQRKIFNDSEYFDFGKANTDCKHVFKSISKQLIFLPRCFQHHSIRGWMKDRYSEFGYKIKRNQNCPPSACVQALYNTSRSNTEESNPNNLDSLIMYKYMRYSETKKELMCRFCQGNNWILAENYLKHLFFAHGILSEFKPHTLYHFESKLLKIQGKLNFKIQVLKEPEFSKKILNSLTVSIIPSPLAYYTQTLNGGFRRIHVKCPHCENWIRLGWCEYDEIIRDSFQDFESLRNLNADYNGMSYIQTRNREDIEGIYENYFTHYIQCDLAMFRTKCLYVQVITKSN